MTQKTEYLPFQSRFVEPIGMGVKISTIRRRRSEKRRIEPGMRLVLWRWTGAPYRSAWERFKSVCCHSVVPISLRFGDKVDSVFVNNWFLDPGEIESLVAGEGFDDWADMRAWFLSVHGERFDGELIAWGKLGYCGI